MSNAEDRMENGSAAGIEARAADWLYRRQFSEWSETDRAEFERWLGASHTHAAAYWRLKAAWQRAETLSALRPLGGEAAKRRLPVLTLRIAAAIAVMAVIGFAGAQLLGRSGERTYSTPTGGHEIVSFSDGSRIELNTDTVLRTRMTTAERTVWLDHGEAYFQVKHDPAHPFIVVAGQHRITDLGTKFLVHRDAGDLEVALIEGRVRYVNDAGEPKSKATLLKPGDVITATTSTMFVTRKPRLALAKELSWRKGLLIFDNTPLAEAAGQINRYNRQKVVIADPKVARLTIDGAFPTSSVQAFTDAAQTLFGLHVENRGDEIVISR
jgi:transmembrane sensor